MDQILMRCRVPFLGCVAAATVLAGCSSDANPVSGAGVGGSSTGGSGGVTGSGAMGGVMLVGGASGLGGATSGSGGAVGGESGAAGGGGSGGASLGGGSGMGTEASGGSSSGAGGTATAGAGGSAPAGCDPELTATNKALVDTAIRELLVEGDITAADRYWADGYLQHNPIAESGVEAFREIFGPLLTPGTSIYEPVRTIGECELVLIHGSYTTFSGPMFDMFRVEDSRLAEHWDAGPSGAGPNTSGHGALDGPTQVEALDLGAQNKALVLAFTEAVLIAGDTGQSSSYLSETLIEHNPNGEDGSTAFMAQRASEAIRYSEVHHVIADGNFVFTMSEGTLGGTAYGFYDLYRLENGLIAEHWDGRRPVPTSTASGLGIF